MNGPSVEIGGGSSEPAGEGRVSRLGRAGESEERVAIGCGGESKVTSNSLAGPGGFDDLP